MVLGFLKKKKDDLPLDVPVEPQPLPDKNVSGTTQMDAQKAGLEGVKMKLDLVLTELDNIKIQNQMLSERLKAIERKMEERRIRYV